MAQQEKEDLSTNKDQNRENLPTGASRYTDLPDNEHDEQRMQPEEVILDLPDVSDIPGQENIVPPQMESFADTTISSDDEEGVGIFGDDEDDDELAMVDGTEADVSETEKTVLQRADNDMPTTDDTNLRRAELDQHDDEGERLNEGGPGTHASGSDLDISGADSDDPMENIGEEDEENNHYSLGSDSNDNVTEGTP